MRKKPADPADAIRVKTVDRLVKISTEGSPRRARAIPRRCFMPSE
jgi:hypothetical protein